MIGRLSGTIIEKQAPQVLVDVNGVGYEVEVPLPTFCQIHVGQSTALWTHLAIREDAHALYGFGSRDERTLFRLLLKITGVGPKLALAILSGIEPLALLRCIELEDLTTLTKIPGVGKKTAERLLIELRDKIKELYPTASSQEPNSPQRLELSMALSPVTEAEQALIALGYKPQEAQKAVALVKNQHQDTANLIRAALKAMIK